MTGEAARRFASPEAAVETVTALLRSEDWRGLLAHYHPPPLPPSASDGEVRAYFLDDAPDGPRHPAGFARYRRPFPPGFSYAGHREGPDGLVEVDVAIRIPQGEGMPDQVGRSTFLLRRLPEGLALIPDPPAGG